jgi:hypothetical protein
MTFVAGFSFLMSVIGLFVFAITRKRAEEAALATLPFPSTHDVSDQRESTPPSSDGVKSAARSGGTTQREARQEEIRARFQTQLCLYCDKRATHIVPRLKQITPKFDRLYRYLNVVPITRWEIIVDKQHSSDACPLCETHHGIARSHLERRVAENQVDYAAFVERQRNEMYEFEEYALDERMLDDANTVKRGKKAKKGADVASIQRNGLKAVNGGG